MSMLIIFILSLAETFSRNSAVWRKTWYLVRHENASTIIHKYVGFAFIDVDIKFYCVLGFYDFMLLIFSTCEVSISLNKVWKLFIERHHVCWNIPRLHLESDNHSLTLRWKHAAPRVAIIIRKCYLRSHLRSSLAPQWANFYYYFLTWPLNGAAILISASDKVGH